AFGTRGALVDGSSGNADLEKTAGPGFARAPGPGTEVGARTTGAAGTAGAPPEAHGVTRCGWRNAVAVDGPAAADACNGGKLFAAGGRPGANEVDGWDADVEAAARATRSKSWRED
ncbi:hypothetical protein FKP32DRAFT_1670840, partial [Trametes sanguinea]